MQGPHVQLFVTCLVDALAPQVGRSTLAALETAGCDVAFPEGQTCCGQPAFNVGLNDRAREMAVHTLDVLDAQLEFVRSQINLVTALRTRIEAEYSLYEAIGRLDAQSLSLSVPYYDSIEHYDRVKNKFWGLTPPPPPEPGE